MKLGGHSMYNWRSKYGGMEVSERIRWRTYSTCDDARRDVFEYVELFYNPKRKHTNNGVLVAR